MINFDSVIGQLGFTPTYTTHPVFGDVFTAMIVASTYCHRLELCIFYVEEKNYRYSKDECCNERNNRMAKTVYGGRQETGQTQNRGTTKEASIREQDEYGTPATTDETNVNLHDPFIFAMDICISDSIWPDCSSFSSRNSVDNVQ